MRVYHKKRFIKLLRPSAVSLLHAAYRKAVRRKRRIRIKRIKARVYLLRVFEVSDIAEQSAYAHKIMRVVGLIPGKRLNALFKLQLVARIVIYHGERASALEIRRILCGKLLEEPNSLFRFAAAVVYESKRRLYRRYIVILFRKRFKHLHRRIIISFRSGF